MFLGFPRFPLRLDEMGSSGFVKEEEDAGVAAADCCCCIGMGLGRVIFGMELWTGQVGKLDR
ncbi:hypothetical protein KY284_033154 [Solanum tuberosum]|nr:hypothetical protein KY284_033154 [Solanum tuberosum]